MSPRYKCAECGGTPGDVPPCGCGPLTHSEAGRAWCAHCDGTGRSYERCDVTGLPVPCSCPECGGTRYADAPARVPRSKREHRCGMCGEPIGDFGTCLDCEEVADACPF